MGYWEDADWKIDFTTLDDTAAFTATAALNAATPRFLRVASFQHSPRELGAAAEAAGKRPFALVRLGSRADLATAIEHTRAANLVGEHELYANWQQMQYMLSMFRVQNTPLDKSRYPDLRWTSTQEVISGEKVDLGKSKPLDSYSDEELIKQFPGFTNHYATVNDVRLHYVVGGTRPAIICLPGWPQI